MSDIYKLARIQIVVIIIFAFFKLARANLIKAFPNEYLALFLYSFPNFAEAIVGTIVVVFVLLWLRNRMPALAARLPHIQTYSLSVFLAAIYVISQELNYHSLGGNNHTDTNDIIFSVIGLIAALLMLLYTKPRLDTFT